MKKNGLMFEGRTLRMDYATPPESFESDQKDLGKSQLKQVE